MTRSSTTITKENRSKLPPRGKSNKTIILNAIRKDSLLGLSKDPTKTDKELREETQEAFFIHIARRAFDVKDDNNAMLLKLLTDKGWASIKPSDDMVCFELDTELTPDKQVTQVVKAISMAELAPDKGMVIISAIKAAVDVEMNTTLKARIEEIEKSLGISNE